MNNIYLNHLKKQYTNATGINTINDKDFKLWLQSRKIDSERYLGFLFRLGFIQIGRKETAEIGKGFYDSIAKPLNSTIITPYIEGLENGRSRVIPKELIVKDKLINNILIDNSISTIVTHNPYNINDLNNWEKLTDTYNLIVGIFGNIYDKDKESKLSDLVSFIDKLNTNYEVSTIKDRDTYCWLVSTKVKKLERRK